MSQLDFEDQVYLKESTEQELKEPPMYRVLLYNDDYTTMDFVVQILEEIFNKSPSDAIKIMLNVHRNGVGICGYYTGEVAETKVRAVHVRAREADFPLRASMESI